jgi:uncharacterized membrane protein
MLVRAQFAAEEGIWVNTSRMEAFSDGVFAIAITLLVLNIHVPTEAELHDQSLLQALLRQWPLYLAYVTSFLTFLIVWINHHHIFGLIGRTDRLLLFLNGLLLMAVAIVPFPTALVSENLPARDESMAAAIYAGTFLVLAILFYLLWHYAADGGRLLHQDADQQAVRRISRQYFFGPPLYLLAIAVTLLSPLASVILCMLLAIFFALPTAGPGVKR